MKLIILKNPFDRSCREIKDIESNKPILDLVKPYIPDCKYEVVLDDRKITYEKAKTLIPEDNQTLAIMAVVAGGGSSDSGHKNIAQTIASIVVAYFAGWAYSAVYKVYGAAAGMAAAMAVTTVGGYLMRLWFGTDKKDDAEATYDWGNVEANVREGGAIQMAYGHIKVGANGQAQVLSQYITYNGTKQYLNILLCGGEGPCDYIGNGEDANCTGITNIKINNNDISNFSGITVYKRAGLNNQSKIPIFDDSYDVKSVSYELDSIANWRTDQTNGTGAGLEVVFEFPYGLYRTKSSGSLRSTSVNIQLQYKLSTSNDWIGWNNGIISNYVTKTSSNSVRLNGNYSWRYPVSNDVTLVCESGNISTTVTSSEWFARRDQDYEIIEEYTIIKVAATVPSDITAIQKLDDFITITRCQNEPVYVVYRNDNIAEGQYDVRARLISKDGTGTKYVNTIYWTSLTNITYDDFMRSNKILLAIKALATDQLSGSVNVTWEQKRSNVWVWVPNNEADPWGSGSYRQKPANNPAWACYDILHGCYYMENINTHEWEYVVKRIPANKFLYTDFKKWADFCDSYNITCAYFVNEPQTLWDTLSPLETIGRGKICQFGTKIGVMCNFPGEVVQKFNYSNIILESFQGEFTEQSERANALEVSFLNADRDFKRQYFPAYGDDYNEVETVNPTSIFLHACSSLDVAWRHAQFQLRMNKYLYRSAKWQCDVDSISCRVGDVVAVSTPKWGVGGRIVNVGDNWIEIEKTIDAFGEVVNGVEKEPGITYMVKITLADDSIISKTVASIAAESEAGTATGTRIYFSEAFANDRAAATYVNATTFTVSGDLTVNFPAGKTDLILYAGYGDIYQTTVSSSSYGDGITTVVCDSVPSDITEVRWAFTKPEQYNLYSFGTDGADCKTFRLMHIERHDDLTATLSGIEYIKEVYEDNTTVPIIDSGANTGTIAVSIAQHTDLGGNLYLDISWLPSRKIYYGALIAVNDVQIAKVDGSGNSYSYGVTAAGTYTVEVTSLDYFGNPFAVGAKTYIIPDYPDLTDPINLVLSDESFILKTGDIVTKLKISWDVPESQYYKYSYVEYSTDNQNWVEVGSFEGTNCTVNGVRIGTTYYVRVRTVSIYGLKSSNGITSSITIVGKDYPPSDVSSLTARQNEYNRAEIILSWDALDIENNPDLKGYEVRVGDNGWETATKINKDTIKDITFTYTALTNGYYYFYVKAIDNSGNYSQNAATTEITVIVIPDAPTNLTAVQDEKDRSVLIVSWAASPGKDIASYQLRYGDGWEGGAEIIETKETAYRWTLPVSGAYNIIVRAVTTAGNISSVANVAATVTIEPYDVTGFTATQSTTDRTVIRLGWDAPFSLDVAYYIIKKGNWDTGEVITSCVSGVFFDTIVKDEAEQTFLIKAVSKAGRESQNPAIALGVYNLNPSPVTVIQASQNANDKSILNIMWDGVSDGDLAGYQVKVGDMWDSAEALLLTQELYTTYKLTKTGNIKIMVKTFNAAGFYSDEKSITYYAEVEPSDVTGLVAYQNGETVELYWKQSLELDVTSYEIREGATFEQGRLVASGLTQPGFAEPVDSERVYRYFVKVINQSGHYSLNAASVSVQVQNLPVKNVIAEYDQIALQNGTHNGTEFGESLINFSNIGGRWPDYPTTKFSDVGGSTVLKLLATDGVYPASGTYACAPIDVGQIITANITAQFVSTVILKGAGSAILQMRTSQDGTNWTDWATFKPVQYTFRYAEFKVLLGTADITKTPEVNQLTIKIDVPDTDIAKTTTIAKGGTTVDYGHTYYTVPIVTPTAIGEGLHPELISKTKSSCVIKIKNASNVDVGGEADIRVKGY